MVFGVDKLRELRKCCVQRCGGNGGQKIEIQKVFKVVTFEGLSLDEERQSKGLLFCIICFSDYLVF